MNNNNVNESISDRANLKRESQQLIMSVSTPSDATTQQLDPTIPSIALKNDENTSSLMPGKSSFEKEVVTVTAASSNTSSPDVEMDNLTGNAGDYGVSRDNAPSKMMNEGKEHQQKLNDISAKEFEQKQKNNSIVSLKTTKTRCKKRRIGKSMKTSLRYDRLFRDSFQFNIPLSVTADIGNALERSKANRIKTIYRLFPTIENNMKQKKKLEENFDDDAPAQELTSTNVDDEKITDVPQNKKKALPVLKHVPKPEDYASVLDYLEAKYVQGIMINDEQVNHDSAAGDSDNPQDEEGGGSVYSESSFIDDTALQRTVAEQVLGQTTTTKLELMQDHDDDFFVNVGNFEVEETELTHSNYDPLQDALKDKIEMSKRKRLAKKASSNPDPQQDKVGTSLSLKDDCSKKKEKTALVAPKKPKAEKESQSSKDATSTAPGKVTSKKRPAEENQSESPYASSSLKKKKLQGANESTKSSSKAVTVEEKVKNNKSAPQPSVSESTKDSKKKTGRKSLSEHGKMLQKNSKMKRKKVDSHMKKIEEYIRNAGEEELPRKQKQKKLRVELKCPPEKKAGDMITFSNPHVPGQKLRVKIPASISENGTFKVTVPVGPPENEESASGEDVSRYNRVSRKFYDLMESFARVYDEWCDTEGEYRSYIGDAEYSSHFEKRKKFDVLVPLFPNRELKFPIDKDFLQKILRRARQNKNKRDKVVATKKMMAEAAAARAAANAKKSSGKKLVGGNNNDENDVDSSDNDDEKHNSNSDDDSGNDSDDDENDGKEVTKTSSSPKQRQGLPTAASKSIKTTRTITLPTFGTFFPKLKIDFRNDVS